MKFYLSDCLMLTRDWQGIDGWGYPITGINRPLWDTLIGLYNDGDSEAVTRWSLWDERTGAKIIWPSGRDYEDLILAPRSSWACTFLPGNPWPQVPIDWMGHGEIECWCNGPWGRAEANVYAWAMLGGGNWDSNTPSCATPVIREPDLDRSLVKSRWIVPYTIPFFADANHAYQDRYTTGISIQNYEDFEVELTLTFTVNQTYPENWRGRSFSWKENLRPHGGVRFFMIERLMQVGFHRYKNAEGHMIVTSDRPAHIEGHAIPGTANFMLGASEPFQ